MKIKKLMVIALTLCLVAGVTPLSAEAAMKGKGHSENRGKHSETTDIRSPKTAAVTGSAITLTLDQTQASVTVGKMTTVKATVTVKKASTKAKKNKKFNSVHWTSSDTTIAKVSKGRIIGLKPGTAVITAMVHGSNDAVVACTVTVVASTAPKADYLALLSAKKFTTEQIALVEANNSDYTDAQWESLLESALVMTKAEWNVYRDSLITAEDVED